MKKGIITRLISHEILYNLKKNNKNFDELQNYYYEKYNLSISDKKLVHNIVLSCMRWHLQTKKIIFKYVKKKISINQYILLLSGVTQLVFLDFKDYAVINSSVELAKHKKINVYPPFINAVLRNVLREIEINKITKITFNNLPVWFLEETRNLGEDLKKDLIIDILEKPNLHLIFKDKSKIKNFNYDYIETSPSSIVVRNPKNIESLPMYKDGEWWIQDYISMLPVSLLDNIKGKDVLDMCSAPGGKAFQAISYGAKIKMVDISKKRALILKKNLKRLKYDKDITISNALNLNEDKKYDFVILDAPCSAVGTIRRNPEIFFRDKFPNIKDIAELQNKLLNKAKLLVKKGGVILYMTCSFLEIETTIQIKKFLEKNPNFKLKKFIEKNT